MTAEAKPRVVSFVEAGPQVGSGHLLRQRELEKSLVSRGTPFTLVRFEGMLEPDEMGTHLSGADVAIFDVATDIARLLVSASKLGVMTCALDWFGEERPDVAFTIYPHGPTDGRLLSRVGADLIVIREEILLERWSPAPTPTYDVVICLGSADVNGETHALGELLGTQGLRVAGVFGPLASLPSPTRAYSQLVNPPSVGRLMRSAAVTVTNGGTCLFEAMTLRACCVALPQTPAETSITKWLGVPQIDARGVAANGALPKDIFVRGATPAYVVRRAFDGLGAERMADAILESWRSAFA